MCTQTSTTRKLEIYQLWTVKSVQYKNSHKKRQFSFNLGTLAVTLNWLYNVKRAGIWKVTFGEPCLNDIDTKYYVIVIILYIVDIQAVHFSTVIIGILRTITAIEVRNNSMVYLNKCKENRSDTYSIRKISSRSKLSFRFLKENKKSYL